MAVVGVVALLVMIGAAYGFIGFSSANGKVSAANRAIDATVSHRNAIDSAPSTFDLSATDATSFQNNAARWMQTWKTQATTIASDDQSLATAGSKLRDQQWLTVLRQGSLNSASDRVDHARKAMKAAATIATDRQAEGKFLVAYATVITDTETLVNDEQTGNSVAALAAASRLPNDVAQTITLANDPQFPPELKQYLASIQTVAQDLVDYLNAEAAGDTAKAKAIQTKANADIEAGNQIDVSQVPTKIDTYYQPFIDTYHNELARAQGS